MHNEKQILLLKQQCIHIYVINFNRFLLALVSVSDEYNKKIIYFEWSI